MNITSLAPHLQEVKTYGGCNVKVHITEILSAQPVTASQQLGYGLDILRGKYPTTSAVELRLLYLSSADEVVDRVRHGDYPFRGELVDYFLSRHVISILLVVVVTSYRTRQPLQAEANTVNS